MLGSACVDLTQCDRKGCNTKFFLVSKRQAAHETNLSTIQNPSQANAWISRAYENTGRSSGDPGAPRQRPRSPRCLNPQSRAKPLARRGRPDRLRGRTQFEAVLAHDCVARGRYFIVRACPNQRCAARLGIIATRKALRRAVDRNACKRIVREAFRDHLAELAGFDVVVVCRRPVLGKTRSLARCELSCLLPSVPTREQRRGVR